jgi:two-component system, NtrC family, sensor histidine kinase HydH
VPKEKNRMLSQFQKNLRYGLQTSPWIILGSTAILLVVVLVLAIQNTHREKRYMSEILSAKGAALIRAVEAGARTGMMGMSWSGRQVQQLLEETARVSDVLYLAVVDRYGQVVAHSDPTRIGSPFRKDRKLIHLGPDLYENWELVDLDNGQRAFEVHRHFRPLPQAGGLGLGRMQNMMRRHGMLDEDSEDVWLSPQKREQLLIVVGLAVTPFEEASQEDIRTTVVLSVVLLLLGFGGFISLFWMHSYRITKQSLQDTSAFANEVVTHLPVGLIATDRTGRVTFFNAAAAKITGLNRAKAKGQVADQILPKHLCGLQKMLDRGVVITEQEMECAFAGGRALPVSVSAARIINEVGDFVGQILILRDLGEVRRLQEEIRRQEKLAALGGLAAGVAHEIRNPLSSIKGLASYFAGQFEEGSEAKEATGVMIQEVDRLNRVITELLEFARPADVKRCMTDLASLLTRSLQLIQQDAAAQNITIALDSANGGCQAWIDPDRMAQCLLNLYLNAIQAMDSGGTLSVSCRADNPEYVHIRVSDTGRGIAAEHLGQIFDPYFTTKGKGTGLGLAIVHKIVEAHQGRLKVESSPGQGSTFTLLIPCREGGGESESHDPVPSD